MPQNEIMLNECRFMGRVKDNPQDIEGHVFFNLTTKYIQRDPNGQFTEISQDIPLLVEPGGPINPAKSYVKTGKQIYVICHFKTWNDNSNMSFIVERFIFGPD